MRGIDFAFLDSGTGGIPYMLYLKEKSPSSKCLYLADSKNFPYGEKTTEQDKRNWFLQQGLFSLVTENVWPFQRRHSSFACNNHLRLSCHLMNSVEKFPRKCRLSATAGLAIKACPPESAQK